MCLFGYWMASNQQLLSNDNLTPVSSRDVPPPSNHTISDVFTSVGWQGPAWPLIVIGSACLLIIFFGRLFTKCLYKCSPGMQIGDIELDEDIDNYWAALDENDRKWAIREEENARNALNMPIMTE